MNERIQRVKAMAVELLALFPESHHVQLSHNPCGIELTVHLNADDSGHISYRSATEFMQGLGVGDRNKRPDTGGYTVLNGSADGVSVTTFPDEMPPTCRLEKVIEKIPKTQTADTGEFIEVERTKIVCGDEREHAEAVSPAG